MKLPRAGVLLALLSLAAGACGVIGESRRLTAAQQFVADIKIQPSDLSIVGWVDRKDHSYETGDKMIFSVWVNRDAYVAVLRVLRSGRTTLLFPNKMQPKALVGGGMIVQIPGPGDRYEVVAGKETPELIEFLASSAGDSWLFTRKPADPAIFVELGATTKALAKDIVMSLQGKNGNKTLAAGQSLVIAVD